MYDWVTHMHTHLGGRCSHECSYCYVQRGRAQLSEKYKGPIRLLEHEFQVNYGEGKTIFIEHMNDMFAPGVKDPWVAAILNHCFQYPKNKYVFQTKNAPRLKEFRFDVFPDCLVGTTIESNRDYSEISKAVRPYDRYQGMMSLGRVKKFVTIEPILDFDVETMVEWLEDLKPEFVNIGADSKKSGLPEPSKEKIVRLVRALQAAKIPIWKKINLERIVGDTFNASA
ncbi:Uncharacterised protein [uncultured archaeon]|nr:Uncharacterised protein [uncultured archaeon]